MSTSASGRRVAAAPRVAPRPSSLTGKTWAILAAIVITASVGPLLLSAQLAPGGASTFTRFWAAALTPTLEDAYLARILEASLTTVAFSVLGTALAVTIGLVGGVLLSEDWWGRRTPRTALRLGFAVPRGMHETIWGIIFLLLLGRDPLVGILALAIPFGAITAKVYAEMIDESDRRPRNALILAGSGRLTAFCYGDLPRLWKDFLAYAFYRLDCALRSAVILGMLGVGGLGFELTTAFQGLAFSNMWTVMYALIIVGLVCELWSAALRTAGARFATISAFTGLLLVVLSAIHLRVSLLGISPSAVASRLARLLEQALPPTLPSTLTQLLLDTLLTLQMSIAAIALAAALGLLLALIASPAPGSGPLRRGIGATVHALLLVVRVTSPPVWALLMLFLLFPGPLPGVLALGLYNAGVLGRLFAEALDTVDRRPALALRELGAGRITETAYGVIPLLRGRLAALSLYRWEVTIRETVIVGFVGAGGLGRVLEAERTAFDYSSMLSVVVALLVLSILVDAVSAAARRAWRA